MSSGSWDSMKWLLQEEEDVDMSALSNWIAPCYQAKQKWPPIPGLDDDTEEIELFSPDEVNKIFRSLDLGWDPSKCTCGSWKTYGNTPTTQHSAWCDLNAKKF